MRVTADENLLRLLEQHPQGVMLDREQTLAYLTRTLSGSCHDCARQTPADDALSLIGAHSRFWLTSVAREDLLLVYRVEEQTVARYAQQMRQGSLCPPLLISGYSCQVLDGTHRGHAAYEADLERVPAIVICPETPLNHYEQRKLTRLVGEAAMEQVLPLAPA